MSQTARVEKRELQVHADIGLRFLECCLALRCPDIWRVLAFQLSQWLDYVCQLVDEVHVKPHHAKKGLELDQVRRWRDMIDRIDVAGVGRQSISGDDSVEEWHFAFAKNALL